MLKRFMSLFTNDLAIDLGTANTLIYSQSEGIVVNEPSVVAIKEESRGVRRILAVGKEAKDMIGRTPDNIKAIRPMKDGVIADFEATQAMLKELIRKSQNKKYMVKPRIIVAVPFGITEVEKRAVREAAQSAGAREIYLIEEPMAAAIGAGLPISEPSGSMIVEIGGGTNEVAIISLYGIVYSKSVRVAGDKMDDAIINYVKRAHNLLIGDITAEQIKKTVGTALEESVEERQTMTIKGNDLVAGVPRHIEITSTEICKALAEPISDIIDNIKVALEKTPPELSADIVDRGIVLSGGGSLIKNLDILIRNDIGLPVFRAENPLCSVVIGAGKALTDPNLLRKVCSR